MSSRIRNTLNAGACALMIGAAAVTLAPIPSSAQLRLDREGGFGNKGGGFGSGRGGLDLGKADHGMHDPREGGRDLGKADHDMHRQGREDRQDNAIADDRDRTAYGTPRAYLDVGISLGDVGVLGDTLLSPNRAFVEWAGITGGITESFYDFYSVPAAAYGGYYTGDINQIAAPTLVPDMVGNIRIDETWGGGGLRLNFPGVAEGDYFQAQLSYISGPTEHYWTPAVHQSIVGAYEAATYNSLANAMLTGLVSEPPLVISGPMPLGFLSGPIVPVPPLTFYSDILTAPVGSLPPLTFNFAEVAGISAGGSDWAGADRLSKDFLP